MGEREKKQNQPTVLEISAQGHVTTGMHSVVPGPCQWQTSVQAQRPRAPSSSDSALPPPSEDGGQIDSGQRGITRAGTEPDVMSHADGELPSGDEIRLGGKHGRCFHTSSGLPGAFKTKLMPHGPRGSTAFGAGRIFCRSGLCIRRTAGL